MNGWLITYEIHYDEDRIERRNQVIHDDPSAWLYDRTRDRINHVRLKKDGLKPPRYVLLFALEIEDADELQLLLQEDE